MKLLLSFVVVSSLLINGCKQGPETDTKDLKSAGFDATGRALDPHWIYSGPLPHLIRPRIVISLKSHTVRVTGVLPNDYNRDLLPFYAVTDELGSASAPKTLIMVAYPIATGDLTAFTEDQKKGEAPKQVSNAPGNYNDGVSVLPFMPEGWGQSDEKIAELKAKGEHPTQWGGFPYVEYNHLRGLALHGPITSAGDTWYLLRGPVSHGCNRMQGEHVVELAHLIGVDMTKTYTPGKEVSLDVPVTVLPEDQFDVIQEPGRYNGRVVDVGYPVTGNVARPTENVLMFDTWDGLGFPQFVCPYDINVPMGPHYCDYKLKDVKGDGVICRVPFESKIEVYSHTGSVIGDAKLSEPINIQAESVGNLRKVTFLSGKEGSGYVDPKYVCTRQARAPAAAQPAKTAPNNAPSNTPIVNENEEAPPYTSIDTSP